MADTRKHHIIYDKWGKRTLRKSPMEYGNETRGKMQINHIMFLKFGIRQTIQTGRHYNLIKKIYRANQK